MYSDHLPCGLDTRLHFLLAVCLQVTVSILAVLGAVYTGFRVNGFLRRSGGLCCELHVRSCHSHLPFPSFLPLLLSLPPSSPLSLLPPLSLFLLSHFPFTDICLHDGGGMFSILHCHLDPARRCMHLLAHLLQSKTCSHRGRQTFCII